MTDHRHRPPPPPTCCSASLLQPMFAVPKGMDILADIKPGYEEILSG
jgi:hypothetical protein